MEEKALARDLTKLRNEAAPAEGPLVSIVVANLDGEAYLKRLIKGLQSRTRYRPIELVLVDNGSTDGSIGVFNRWEGQKQLIQNSENQSFARANNQGIRAASGELVLLANNDIEPVDPNWLGFMVESLADDVVAVGAMLVYSKRPKRENPPAYPDLTVQHIGTCFEYSGKGVRAVNMGAGMDPRSITTPTQRDVPAVTAACLLARRSDLMATPFDEHYWYGSEDWDLCLRLGNRGRVVIDERAVLYHHEFGTQDRFMSEAWLERRARNHEWFNDLWGPALMRQLRSEATGPPSEWFFRGTHTPTLGITVGTDARTIEVGEHLSREAERAGWRVTDVVSRACDLAISLAPPDDVHSFASIDMSLAVVLDRHGEWARSGSLDAAQRVAVPDRLGQARLDAAWGSGLAEIVEALDPPRTGVFSKLLGLVAPRPNSMRIGVSTCAPDWEKAQYWGDTHLARGLMRAFRRLGHETAELIAEDWDGGLAKSCDVVIHLRGLRRRPVARGQWNLLWVISHPDRLEPGECDDYDLVASASQRHAGQLSAELGRQVHYIPQATDADTFKPGAKDETYEDAVLYVGNARWPSRRAPRWLMRNGRPFQLYGKFWDNQPEAAFLYGDYISNHDLAKAYRSAPVVVADHHGSMRSDGFLANRLFDVLASGGVVLSDEVRGLPDVFGDLIPTYSDPRELESQLRVLLEDAALRRRIAQEGRRVVLSEHTLDHRARTWLELLDQL